MNSKNVRSFFAVAVSGILFTGGIASAFAQLTAGAPPAAGAPSAPAAGAAGKRVKMADELGLTPDQKKQFEAITKSARDERKALKTQNLAPAAAKAKNAEIMKSTMTKYMAILTPAQIEKFKSIRAAGRKGAAPPAPAAPPAGAAKP